jgi:hypothetical protein
MSLTPDIPVSEFFTNAFVNEKVIMVRAPSSRYAGHVGAEAIVTDVTNGSVYVMFESGMRDCYPPKQFHDLFRRRRRAAND